MLRSTLILAFLLPAAADEVILSDGSSLGGTVTALADSGEVSLESPLSFEPFQLLAEKIKRVDFTGTTKSPDDHDALVILANGDRFPGELTGIDDSTISISTGFSGNLRIPREAVDTVQLGVRPRKVIYRGPESDAGWTIKSGWSSEGKRFVATRSGTIARNFDIPGSFSLRFRVTWRNSPNMQIYFADDSLETTGKADRYYLNFVGSGLELKRQQSNDGHPYLPMASILRDSSEFPSSSVEVDLRVDRKLGIVHLYLDGDYEGRFDDPMKSAPSGMGIMFRSNIGGEDSQEISRIEIREWDASSDRHRSEERGDASSDVLITRSEDRGTGSIISYAPGPDGGTIRYKGPHQPEPVDLPANEVSTLFFARTEVDPAADPAPLQLGLRGRGSLGVSACSFAGDSIMARHSLLGDLEIRRDAVASLERAGEETTEEEEP